MLRNKPSQNMQSSCCQSVLFPYEFFGSRFHIFSNFARRIYKSTIWKKEFIQNHDISFLTKETKCLKRDFFGGGFSFFPHCQYGHVPQILNNLIESLQFPISVLFLFLLSPKYSNLTNDQKLLV